MTATLTISGKVMGRTRPVFTDWHLSLPASCITNGTLSLRSLLTQIVLAEVDAFKLRQSQRQLLRILSPEQIRLGLEQGKVDLGGSELDQVVEPETAVDVALEAFQDGLYFVFVDDQHIETLESPVTLHPDSQLLFLRLIALVGG